MSPKKIDYSKTLIYKLCCNDPRITDIYVGATTDFIRRKQQHKTKVNKFEYKNFKPNSKVYKFIYENGGFENWGMILIEAYPCTTSLESRQRERHYILELMATLNTVTPCNTLKETYKKNKQANKFKVI
jgi:hypothetical protein